MPAVRTRPRDVLIRVPKVEPYSNSYVAPSARAKEEAKRLAAAAVLVTADASAAAGEASTSAADPTAKATSNDAAVPAPDVVEPVAEASTTATTAPAPTESHPDASGSEPKDRSQRGNSPTLAFLSVDRQEEQTIDLSKAATSSAGWNSLLVWARRQRGAQWDASTALWQVDKYSREYYSFCEHPATTDRSKQPGTQEASAQPGAGADEDKKPAVEGTGADEDEDKGPAARSSSRGKADAAASVGAGGSPPPVPTGRSIRLLRR